MHGLCIIVCVSDFSIQLNSIFICLCAFDAALFHQSRTQLKGFRAGEMGRWLRLLVALPEDLG